MKHVYYENDVRTFRGAFKVDGVAQTPDTGTAKIRVLEHGRTPKPFLAETAASISGTQIYHKLTLLRAGIYRLFFTAEYDSGADKITGVINYVVRKKVAQ